MKLWFLDLYQLQVGWFVEFYNSDDCNSILS